MGEERLDPDEFIRKVKRSSQHRTFYHFTDPRNLSSIRKHGLISTKKAVASKVKIAAPGGNEWSKEADEQRGLDGFVHLCLTSSHPMAYIAEQEGRIRDVKYLQVAPEILKLEGVLISDGVSNKSDAQILAVPEMLNKIDYEVLYTRTDWKDPEIQERLKVAEKFEVLVPDEISLKYILNLHNG